MKYWRWKGKWKRKVTRSWIKRKYKNRIGKPFTDPFVGKVVINKNGRFLQFTNGRKSPIAKKRSGDTGGRRPRTV